MKAVNVILFFKQLTKDLIVLKILGLFGLNVAMNDKVFSFDGFLGFRKSFCGIERASRNLCFLANLGNGILEVTTNITHINAQQTNPLKMTKKNGIH